MYFRMVHDERSAALGYLLADLDAGEAVLVDPQGRDVPLWRAMLAEHRLRVRWVLRTHDHDDRLADAGRDAQAALNTFGAPVVAHVVPAEPVLAFGDEFVRVLATPGHTDRCLSFHWRDRVFCGGLLAIDACPYQPRPRSPEALWDSVTERLFRLPDETLLFGGHARGGHARGGRVVSTVFEERRWHPWFGGASRDECLARIRGRVPVPGTGVGSRG